ncbi:hypothetical protein [Cellulosimicrobium cellulans]|uniref:hypothetical protein n=1 Tax=Cellulosimicrobium cellulans TaxID=1710 RepID=UPI0024049AA3|nr:hypothetical protein [Cellulosimicrobium cellulans]MDF9878287.1 hypothetical protein [Cellulosimicrobium cellulans]
MGGDVGAVRPRHRQRGQGRVRRRVRRARRRGRRGRDDLARGARLRPLAARALDAYAAALRSVDSEPADEEGLRTVAACAEDLRGAVREARQEVDEDYFVAGAVVLALRRGAAVLAAP